MSQAPAAFSNAYHENHDYQQLLSFPLLALAVSRLCVLNFHLVCNANLTHGCHVNHDSHVNRRTDQTSLIPTEIVEVFMGKKAQDYEDTSLSTV